MNTYGEQLSLEIAGPKRVQRKDEVGLRNNLPKGGPERLVAELVKRGLSEGDLHMAAALAIALDEGAGH